MIAMRERWPFLPEVRLYHDPDKVSRYITRHWNMVPRFMEVPGAQTWYADGAAVVLLDYAGDRVAEDALLTHEAYHVFYRHMDFLCEDAAGEEIMAYGIQEVSEALMRAHKRWRRKHVSGH